MARYAHMNEGVTEPVHLPLQENIIWWVFAVTFQPKLFQIVGMTKQKTKRGEDRKLERLEFMPHTL